MLEPLLTTRTIFLSPPKHNYSGQGTMRLVSRAYSMMKSRSDEVYALMLLAIVRSSLLPPIYQSFECEFHMSQLRILFQQQGHQLSIIPESVAYSSTTSHVSMFFLHFLHPTLFWSPVLLPYNSLIPRVIPTIPPPYHLTHGYSTVLVTRSSIGAPNATAVSTSFSPHIATTGSSILSVAPSAIVLTTSSSRPRPNIASPVTDMSSFAIGNSAISQWLLLTTVRL
jgi:hypothetical protein